MLFTQAFVEATTTSHPVVLQKVQPLVAVVGASVILGERMRPRFVAVSRAGARRGVADRRPASVPPDGARTAADALRARRRGVVGARHGARAATSRATCASSTSRRCASCSGSPASAVALLVLSAPAFASWHDSGYIALLAFVTGFLALGLYYYGLQTTPAVAATIAELAFPVSAILVGYFKFGQTLTGWQWVGVASRRPSSRCCRRGARDAFEDVSRCAAPPSRQWSRSATSGRATASRTSRTCSRPSCAPSWCRGSLRPACRGSRRCRSCATIASRRWRARRRSLRPPMRGDAELSGLVLNERG